MERVGWERLAVYPERHAVRLLGDSRGYVVAVDWFDGRVSIDETEAK